MIVGRKFVTWQPVITDHQAYTFQALARLSGVPAVAYVTAMEDAVRKAQGWKDTRITGLDRHLIPKRGFFSFCYSKLKYERSNIHLFCSPFQQPKLMLCMLLAAGFGVEFYLISEPYSPRAESYLADGGRWLGRIKAMLRPSLYRIYGLLLRNHLSGIFSISSLAMLQYQQAGVSLEKIFPFGYFIPSADPGVPYRWRQRTKTDQGLRMVFVGSMIQRKGLDILQVAMRILYEQGRPLWVDIFGSGDPSFLNEKESRLRYCGIIPFGEAQSVIADYDLLVLPSRFDGWGVVVNEALCAGVPVVCSSTTGAGRVAERLGAGLCFASGDAVALSEILSRLIEEPLLLQSMRVATTQAADALQPEVAARYMLDVIQAPVSRKAKLRSPWYPQHVCDIRQ